MSYITSMNISQVNLNLLLAFDALMTDRHVTRAAHRCGVTQSAMSNSLKQLRALFDDPLFLRGQRGVTPTARALSLAGPIRSGLAAFEQALAPQRFDPRRAERTFVVLASDYMEFVLLPPLVRRLAKEAPGVKIHARAWGLHEAAPALADGSADLMLGYTNDVPAQHREQILFEEEYVCVLRKGHPRVAKRLSLPAYVELEHVVVSQHATSGAASVDRALAARGLERRIGARVSHFLMVPRLVAETDMVAALSRRVAEPLSRAFAVRVLAPPLKLPKSRPSQVWHERSHTDPSHAWLRDLVADVARSV